MTLDREERMGNQENRCVNSCFYSYQRFSHMNEVNGSFSILLTRKPRLHASVKKKNHGLQAQL